MSLLDGFEVIETVTGIPTMSITRNGITFNKTVLEKLSRPEFAKAMIDKQGKQMAIVPCDKDDRGCRTFYKNGREIANGVRWNNHDLKATLETLMGWNLESQGWKSTGVYLENENAMLFDLKEVEPLKRG